MSKIIFEVTQVTLEILKKNPPILSVTAKGNVSSGGWSNAQLSPFVYVMPPSDGIYEFDFVADEPEGTAIQVISEISSKPFVWENFPLELKGVKVYASSNFIAEKIR